MAGHSLPDYMELYGQVASAAEPPGDIPLPAVNAQPAYQAMQAVGHAGQEIAQGANAIAGALTEQQEDQNKISAADIHSGFSDQTGALVSQFDQLPESQKAARQQEFIDKIDELQKQAVQQAPNDRVRSYVAVESRRTSDIYKRSIFQGGATAANKAEQDIDLRSGLSAAAEGVRSFADGHDADGEERMEAARMSLTLLADRTVQYDLSTPAGRAAQDQFIQMNLANSWKDAAEAVVLKRGIAAGEKFVDDHEAQIGANFATDIRQRLKAVNLKFKGDVLGDRYLYGPGAGGTPGGGAGGTPGGTPGGAPGTVPGPSAPAGPGVTPPAPTRSLGPAPGAGSVMRPGGATNINAAAVTDAPTAVERNLAADRAAGAHYLDTHPNVKEAMLRFAVNEQGSNPRGVQAVIETMFNRAAVEHKSLGDILQWYDPVTREGYYAHRDLTAGEWSRGRPVAQDALARVMAGSNVSLFATDNASQELAQERKRTGSYTHTVDYGGESFFGKGWGQQDFQRMWTGWAQRMQRQNAPPVARTAPAGGPTPLPPARWSGPDPTAPTPSRTAAPASSTPTPTTGTYPRTEADVPIPPGGPGPAARDWVLWPGETYEGMVSRHEAAAHDYAGVDPNRQRQEQAVADTWRTLAVVRAGGPAAVVRVAREALKAGATREFVTNRLNKLHVPVPGDL